MVVPRWEDEHLSGLLVSLGLPNDHYLGAIKDKYVANFCASAERSPSLEIRRKGNLKKTLTLALTYN